ncbi:Retrovirus-related Pol polyprotein from transposon TNT 1-94 [Araneus ventricosus]|uniref:Retrovirus-related Pol polyprotein from transposon TNT 1-94 n=1 Tax=Araneus ventricosus TaxID=182803 RepID=A0A4Y2LNS5_ARAVE|nr:Retrovirus-related Pol polyprotein from transposon TNT 1-94 [Araneus ventricosus]
MSFDMRSLNTGKDKGACVLLKEKLGKKLFYFACCHHIMELIIGKVFYISLGIPSSSPEVPFFKRFQEYWGFIDRDKFEAGLKEDNIKVLLQDTKDEILEFATRQESLSIPSAPGPRDDYLEFVELVIIFLGGIHVRGIRFRLPGAMNYARWMSKPHGNFELIKSAFSTARTSNRLLDSLPLECDSCKMNCATSSKCFKPKESPPDPLKFHLSKQIRAKLTGIENLNIKSTEFDEMVSPNKTPDVFPDNDPWVGGNDTNIEDNSNHEMDVMIDRFSVLDITAGVTSHMCLNEHLFTEINPIDNTYVKLAIDKTVKIIAKGTVTFDVLIGNQTKGITLQNVLYIPDLKNNLISISKVTANNLTVKFQRNHASVINSKNETGLIAKCEKGLYYVTAIVESMSIVKEIEQWHQKFGHLNAKDLEKLQCRTWYADGSIALRKARLVAKGFAQIPDVDYQETFAPVTRPGSIRTVMTYCAENNLDIFQLHFIMAYVNGDVDEEIFMEQADHFIDQKHPDYVYKLQRSLYGLKQAGRQWFCKLDEKLKSFDLNPLSSEKFNMQDAKKVKTPLDPSIKLTKEMCPKTEAEKAEMSLYPYWSLIGSLMYLAICTRPDICHTVSYLSQFNENASMPHWTAAKRVFKYLKGTKNRGLTFRPTKRLVVGYADVNWASDITDRKSYSGCVLKFADRAISWESKKQHCVALSSTEVEYIALYECAKEIVYLCRFLNELYDSVDETPTVVFSDSQAAQKLVQNLIFHSRTKHIDIRCHYIHEVYERGEIRINYIPTDKMAADILTKTLTFQA